MNEKDMREDKVGKVGKTWGGGGLFYFIKYFGVNPFIILY